MNKEQTYEFLKASCVSFEITEHGAVFNMEDLRGEALPYPDRMAKNLFVRDEKKRNYYLITVKEDRQVNLKAFRKAHGLKNLSFASPEDLKAILDLTPGSVTPLGALNDGSVQVVWYLDAALADGLIGVHPNDNTATVWVQAADLVKLLKRWYKSIEIVEMEEPVPAAEPAAEEAADAGQAE